MNLLVAFILKNDSNAVVKTQHSWEPVRSGKSLKDRLKLLDSAFPRGPGDRCAYILFDEAQDTYEDKFLWNDFFKGVGDGGYSRYRVILFCSYGCPSARPVIYSIGTPLELTDEARISLRPRNALGVPIGLLLNRFEFDEVVSLFSAPLNLNLHPDLTNLIFEWTSGHVGAVIKMLEVISQKASLASESRCSCILTLFSREDQKSDVRTKSQ